MKKNILSFIFCTLLILFDQFTKYIAQTTIKTKGEIKVIGDIFTLRYLENRGAAFGILNNQRMFFIILTLVFCVLFIIAFLKIPANKKYLPLNFLIIFIFSGAVGNFIDRIYNGFVTDFLYFKLINFPIFNVADIYITVSCTVLVILFLFVYKDEDWDYIFNKKKSSDIIKSE